MSALEPVLFIFFGIFFGYFDYKNEPPDNVCLYRLAAGSIGEGSILSALQDGLVYCVIGSGNARQVMWTFCFSAKSNTLFRMRRANGEN